MERESEVGKGGEKGEKKKKNNLSLLQRIPQPRVVRTSATI